MIDDKIMHRRRIERLERLNFFMKEQPALRQVALSESHNLLTGFFSNSYWRTAWYCLKKAVRRSWVDFTFEVWFYWNRWILRQSEGQMKEKLDVWAEE